VPSARKRATVAKVGNNLDLRLSLLPSLSPAKQKRKKFRGVSSRRSSRFLSFFLGGEIEQARKRASEGARLGSTSFPGLFPLREKPWERGWPGVSKKL